MAQATRILVFTGPGKGKTTAALGMALRAVGHGMPVTILQFIKADERTGEIAALAGLPGVTLRQVGRGFVPPPTDPRFPAHREAARQGLDLARQAIAAQRTGLLVLDEICIAVSRDLVQEEQVLALLREAGNEMTVALTGRDATPGLIQAADTVTEMQCVKHALEAGRPAQKGVEQ